MNSLSKYVYVFQPISVLSLLMSHWLSHLGNCLTNVLLLWFCYSLIACFLAEVMFWDHVLHFHTGHISAIAPKTLVLYGEMMFRDHSLGAKVLIHLLSGFVIVSCHFQWIRLGNKVAFFLSISQIHINISNSKLGL